MIPLIHPILCPLVFCPVYWNAHQENGSTIIAVESVTNHDQFLFITLQSHKNLKGTFRDLLNFHLPNKPIDTVTVIWITLCIEGMLYQSPIPFRLLAPRRRAAPLSPVNEVGPKNSADASAAAAESVPPCMTPRARRGLGYFMTQESFSEDNLVYYR